MKGMTKKLFALSFVPLMLSACLETPTLEEEEAAARGDTEATSERRAGDPAEKPVRIGLGGPRFDACQAVGRVQGLRGRQLDVRISHFDSAKSKGQIGEGQQVWICDRSHDQQWFGIAYDDGIPEAAEGDGEAVVTSSRGPGDCGVAAPVRQKRNYDGPCKSGWVESTFVKLVAG